MCNDGLNNSILNTLIEIESAQKCNIDTFKNELGKSCLKYNTVPIILMCKSCNCYIGSGIFNDPLTCSIKCFKTPVFRVTRVNCEEMTVILELLQPQTINGDISNVSCFCEVCEFFSSATISKYIRTGIYTKVNINCFCGIECLQPVCARCGIPKGCSNNPYIDNVETSEYVSISDGIKKTYLNSDGIEEFNVILNPLTISYANLFVNGVLQPPSYYTFVEGRLTLNTDDAPISGSYIILQFIKINR